MSTATEFLNCNPADGLVDDTEGARGGSDQVEGRARAAGKDQAMSSPFEQLCAAALAAAGTPTPAAREKIFADLRLRFEHPDVYVAYLDRWRTEKETGTRKLHRKIIAASRDLREIQKALEALTPKARRTVRLDYVDPLDSDLIVPATR